jgi:hypothetical protein
MRRRKSPEIAEGYPGFAYHNVTTEDYTMVGERFVVRPVPNHPGNWVVHHYVCSTPKVVKGKRRRFFI